MLDVEKLWWLLGASVTAIVGLIAVLYGNMTSQLKDLQKHHEGVADKLADGKVMFEAQKNAIEAVSKELGYITQDIAEIGVKQVQDHEAILAIKIHHKHQHDEDI